MKPLRIEATRETPEILFNPEKDIFHIKGVSHPEDIKEFFFPIFEWLDDFFEESKNEMGKRILFHLSYKYINSSSLKHLYEFLKKLTIWRDQGLMIEIDWYYADDDEDMLETGEELSEMQGINLPFHYMAYSEDHDLS